MSSLNPFDIECFGGKRRSDYRTPFQIDRDRILHTSSFRRLQGKTQVFWSGEYDFYRTRLTHSLEVAQIGKSITRFLGPIEKDPASSIDPDLIEAVCLAHDIGHPPFGHSGERALNALMTDYGGFEGNAQTLRLLTETIFSSGPERRGMKPTRALMDGVMKYKALRDDYARVDRFPPAHHFLYSDQSDKRDFVHGPASASLFSGSPEESNASKSLECQVMDWADDTAYCLNDLADGIQAGFLTSHAIHAWMEEKRIDQEGRAPLDAFLEAVARDRLHSFTAMKIGTFITATSLAPRDHPLGEFTRRYRYDLVVDADVRAERNLYGRLALDLIYRSPRVHQLEYKGRRILEKIFHAFAETYVASTKPSLHLLPRPTEQELLSTDDEAFRMRRICDYVAGMTDGFAVRTYKRLFDPDFGSIADLV